MNKQKPICRVEEIERQDINSEFKVWLREDVYEVLEQKAKRNGMTVAELINYKILLKFVHVP